MLTFFLPAPPGDEAHVVAHRDGRVSAGLIGFRDSSGSLFALHFRSSTHQHLDTRQSRGEDQEEGRRRGRGGRGGRGRVKRKGGRGRSRTRRRRSRIRMRGWQGLYYGDARLQRLVGRREDASVDFSSSFPSLGVEQTLPWGLEELLGRGQWFSARWKGYLKPLSERKQLRFRTTGLLLLLYLLLHHHPHPPPSFSHALRKLRKDRNGWKASGDAGLCLRLLAAARRPS
eukprot:753800-Hanusia_phi.AAC.1